MDFGQLEHDVIQILLKDAEEHIRNILYNQYKTAQVIKRDFTGVGFFTDFAIQDDIERLENRAPAHFGNIVGKIDNIQVGFILFGENGAISCLEGFTYDKAWPDKIATYELKPFKFT